MIALLLFLAGVGQALSLSGQAESLSYTWSELWQKLTAATSSHAATSRGVSQYTQGKFKDAAGSFADADKLRRSPKTAFNLGTAQVATGNREQGSQTLAKAMTDPQLRADALYNRGNSALAANAFDPAIRDFAEVLRMRPNDLSAKRNLEIALRKKMEQSKQPGAGDQQTPQGAQQQQNQANRAPAPGDKNAQQPKGETDAEALLRAVQQQEQEELTRMRQSRPAQTRVGW
jgi:tetratricopeptide (TPR) repeat protein